ncbi:MAG: hypothetical protein R3D44_11865 [Hyphomicrobiaceae bacterium]
MSDGPGETDARMLGLIRASLAVWEIDAAVATEEDGRWRLSLVNGDRVVVGRAPAGIPFRWMVTSAAGRERPASSVTGLLRVLRSTIDPKWKPGRVRIVPLTPPAS